MKAALLFAAFAVLFLVRLGTPGLIDYDEAAYAQAAHEMLLRGDWLSPSLNGEPFFEKPPLLYWGQIVGYQAFGVGAFGARLGNALAALATLAALYGFSRRPLGERVAWLGALVLGSCLAFVSLARVALTDVWLLLCMTLAIGCFHRAVEAANDERRSGSRWFVGFCACAGLAMLAKGAIGVLLPAAAALLQLASLRRLALLLRPAWWLPGAAALLGIGLSWYLLLGATRPDGFHFMTELFLEHHVARFASAKEGHRGPLLYYLPVLAIALVPWSAFVPIALARPIDAASERGRWLRLLGLLSAVTLLFFSAAATKLPHYAVPALPGLALLIADRLAGASAPPARRALAWSVAATVALLVTLAAGLAAAPRSPRPCRPGSGRRRARLPSSPTRSISVGLFSGRRSRRSRRRPRSPRAGKGRAGSRFVSGRGRSWYGPASLRGRCRAGTGTSCVRCATSRRARSRATPAGSGSCSWGCGAGRA